MLQPLCVTLAALLLAGCSTAASSPSVPAPRATVSPSEAASSSPTAEASASDAPTASPSAGERGAVVVTFLVRESEEYRILLTQPDDIELARAWFAGEEGPLIPNGLVVRGDDGGVNTGYSWHIDPDDVDLAEFTVEVCDGLPSYIEAGTLSGERFCPWTAQITAIEPADG